MLEMERKMKRMNINKYLLVWFSSLFLILICSSTIVQANRPGWRCKKVNHPITSSACVQAVHYPEGKEPLLFFNKNSNPTIKTRRNNAFKGLNSRTTVLTNEANPSIISYLIIDSPPLGGFLSWCTMTVTDESSGELEIDAVPSNSVVGNYLTDTPENSYGIAVFDTGAGAHIIGSNDAMSVGLFDYQPSLITSNITQFTGVTGLASAWVSQPLGLFIDGLDAIGPNGLLIDNSYMVGEYNVSIAIGDPIDSPNLLSTIGTPLSVYLAAVYHNDRLISFTHNGTELLAPKIDFYMLDDPQVPSYPNIIPLELRPTGSVSVQYFPNILDPFDPDFGAPLSPSVISGFLPMQGLFFASSVDVTHNDRTVFDKDGFIFDTGSSYTLISEAIGARLGLDLNNPEFELELLIATGEMLMAPGFYIDSFEVVATPEWLEFKNVPVIVLDAPSPEGGTLDGIIGMNLFVDFNLIFRGGGLSGQDLPRIEFERIPVRIIGDIAPESGDGVVDLFDLAAFASAWLTNSESFNWNPRADIAPETPDGIVDFLDWAVLARQLHDSNTP
jgi:hypothetical protein